MAIGAGNRNSGLEKRYAISALRGEAAHVRVSKRLVAVGDEPPW